MPSKDPVRPEASAAALPFPEELGRRYAGWSRTLHYAYVPELPTWRLDAPTGQRHFLKIAYLGRQPGLADERARLEWAADRLPVPRVMEYRSDGTVEWLLTDGLPGVDATDEKLCRRPDVLVPILARGLRAIHETPAADCPFDFQVAVALERVKERAARGLIHPAADFHPEHGALTTEQAIEKLEHMRPATEDVVLCHGDYCFPNALIEDGIVTGYLDLGQLGLADRWWDVAVATWSVTWNVGPGWEDLFLESYGIEPDPERIAFYRLLYDLAS